MNIKSPENVDRGTLTLQTIQKARRFNQWMYETIKPFFHGEILEIGSGLGNISRYPIEDNFCITLSDVNPGYCEILKAAFQHFPNVRDVLSIDLQHPDFFTHYGKLKEKFETVFLLNVIEHLENDRAAILNCSFLLRKGGNLIVLAPSYPSLYCRLDKELGHYRRYTQESLCAVLESSLFDLVNCRHFNFAGIAGWIVFGKVLRHQMIGNSEMSVFENFVPFFKKLDRILFNKAGLSIIVTGRKK